MYWPHLFVAKIQAPGEEVLPTVIHRCRARSCCCCCVCLFVCLHVYLHLFVFGFYPLGRSPCCFECVCLLILVCCGSYCLHIITWDQLFEIQVSPCFFLPPPFNVKCTCSNGVIAHLLQVICCVSTVSWIRLLEKLFLIIIIICYLSSASTTNSSSRPPLGGLPSGCP